MEFSSFVFCATVDKLETRSSERDRATSPTAEMM